MDMRLADAARTGNIEHLHSLGKNDPLILNRAAVEGGQTPLHVAALADQVEFTREILKVRPKLAEEMNPDGLTPWHIASANGNLEMVRELLNLSPQLCLSKGKERRIPLHYAALKGRTEVLKELLSACLESIKEVTALCETALHLAVKSSHFEVFTLLVEELKNTNRVNFLNRKDAQGNTILYLAVSARQYEVVDFILNGSIVNAELVEVNAVNKMGLTAFNALSVFPSEAGDKEIGDILILAGATTMRIATELPEARATSDPASKICPQTGTGLWGLQILTLKLRGILKHDRNNWNEYFKFKKDRDSPDSVRSALLVVAALITATTYQAVLQPPGGLWQDNSGPLNSTTNSTTSNGIFTQSHKAGQAVMANINPISYIFFLFCNSIGFFAAIQMIWILTARLPLQLELRIAGVL
ncbi:ankyrin repeat-containing protein BDA1-like [Punica granatum]|uniref:Ankyrin repeat-containing protein BDA1-like n=1 Tax=Punica granatum TaxID=22663 RepID=A0A6P8DGY4_PUNGR|nr:ankyrin repeat-containing protein BDA1-like [Punica granatum]XP_031395795.1 ankyrin repeat-containing protein BDA1-like [Punica granatum]